MAFTQLFLKLNDAVSWIVFLQYARIMIKIIIFWNLCNIDVIGVLWYSVGLTVFNCDIMGFLIVCIDSETCYKLVVF